MSCHALLSFGCCGRRKTCLHATPLAWLQAGCEGIAILDWDMGVRQMRGLGDHVQLRGDRGASKRLTALLQHGGIPRVKETGLPPVRRAA